MHHHQVMRLAQPVRVADDDEFAAAPQNVVFSTPRDDILKQRICRLLHNLIQDWRHSPIQAHASRDIFSVSKSQHGNFAAHAR